MEFNFKNPKLDLVFKYFEEISKIPRGSGNEKEISDYLASEGKRLNLEVIQDNALNVIIKKPASPGYENAPAVILQGHMDMVCEKNKDIKHDFTKDPIKLQVKENYLYADGTTLGADNGTAVAMGLALLASDDIKMPKLEVVFTANEEVSMEGAMNLDGSHFEGRYIINLDSEEEGRITVSCAGGVTAIVDILKELKDITPKQTYLISIKGLKGGHSGIEIDKKRANSNLLMGRVLNALEKEKVNYDLISISGGLKNNAIPREAEATINLDSNDEKQVVKVLNLMPRNIQTMSADIENLVESSTNLGVVVTENDSIKFEFATRSSVKTLKDDINDRMQLLCDTIGVNLTLEDDYPEWEYAKDSKLEQICVETYEKINGKKPEIVAIHAGLECGLLLDAIEGAQAVSIGPNLFDVHTPDEHIDLLSTERTWDYLVSILGNIK